MKITQEFFWGALTGGIVMVLICAVILLVIAWKMQVNDAASAKDSKFCPEVGDREITQLLVPIRQKHRVLAMAALLVTTEGVQFFGAVGSRKRGTEISVTPTDLWHLGSNGKAMTSTLIARLVEGGRLRWDQPLVEYLPELASQMHPDFQKVTLLHLLSHRAGLPANLELADYLGGDVRALRHRAATRELSKKPLHPPGKVEEYSNLGYIIAAATVEKITGQSWEEMIRQELFDPLQMKTAGFGGTGTMGKVDQPWPHLENGRPVSENGSAMDNPPVMGPAGRIHCSMQDWARFIQDQLRGARGESALLTPASYQKLLTPPLGGDYALGWQKAEREWGGGEVWNHTGDNTMNHANVWVAPKRNFAILVCVNQSGDDAFAASDEAASELIERYEELKRDKK